MHTRTDHSKDTKKRSDARRVTSGKTAPAWPSAQTDRPDHYLQTPFDRNGVAAELAAVPARVLAPKPRTLDHVQSAVIPLPALSAWQGLFDHGGLQAGERVLITGAAGGVGHLAVQLARVYGAELASNHAGLRLSLASTPLPG